MSFGAVKPVLSVINISKSTVQKKIISRYRKVSEWQCLFCNVCINSVLRILERFNRLLKIIVDNVSFHARLAHYFTKTSFMKNKLYFKLYMKHFRL